MTFTRQLGRSGLEISAMGIGCWAIGGPFWWDGNPVGWGQVDDKQSIRGLQRALDLGVNFFDTADVYGCGHSERILAQAALGWLWARSESTIPIPGFKTLQQIEENIQALEFGALSKEQMRTIEGLIDRSSDAFSRKRESDD